MRAIVLDRPGEFRVAEVPDPAPRAGQIVVKVEACGVCGTDIHIMDGEFPPTPYPITPGHEFAGTVAAIAPDVTLDLAPGDRVAVDPSLYCGYCRRCRSGRDNLCELLASGAVDVRPLLSPPLPLEGFGAALNRVRAGQGIKTHVRPS